MKLYSVMTISLVSVAACAMDGSGGEEVDSGPDTTESVVSDVDTSGAATAGFDSCLPGEICFYTGRAGGGRKCSWTSHDSDWTSGAITCSWAASSNVCSVFNRTSERVEYFKGANYSDRVGSTLPSIAGDLACSYQLRSHRFQR